jgi:hypothetical protein
MDIAGNFQSYCEPFTHFIILATFFLNACCIVVYLPHVFDYPAVSVSLAMAKVGTYTSD